MYYNYILYWIFFKYGSVVYKLSKSLNVLLDFVVQVKWGINKNFNIKIELFFFEINICLLWLYLYYNINFFGFKILRKYFLV